MPNGKSKIVVISGASSGMGKAVALRRLAAGDEVVAIASNAAKLAALRTEADRYDSRLLPITADLTSIAEMERVGAQITARFEHVDALLLTANRVLPNRVITADGLEATFALYYLSRFVLTQRLTPHLTRSAAPVVISVAGVGNTAGTIHWDDLQLAVRYRAATAQLQAGRLNDLLGVSHSQRHGDALPYVMYHPGFTKSGDMSSLPRPVVWGIKALAAGFARSVAASTAPILKFIADPPRAALTAIDRGKPVSSDLATLRPRDAERLHRLTVELLSAKRDGHGRRARSA